MDSNYDKMAEQARVLFLQYDQEEMIRKWDLKHDANALYLRYFRREYKIARADGRLSLADPEDRSLLPEERGGKSHADLVNAAMAIYDILCYAKERPQLSGRWESLSSIGGIIGAGHEGSLSDDDRAKPYSGHIEALRTACEKLGGVSTGKADAGYIIPAFDFFPIRFQFWDADEEFPASVKYLWDANALQFMHYETLWYVMGSLDARLEGLIL